MKPNTPLGGGGAFVWQHLAELFDILICPAEVKQPIGKDGFDENKTRKKKQQKKQHQRYEEKQEGRADPVCFLKKEHWKGNVANAGGKTESTERILI